MRLTTIGMPSSHLPHLLAQFKDDQMSLAINTPPGVGTVFRIQHALPTIHRVVVDIDDVRGVHAMLNSFPVNTWSPLLIDVSVPIDKEMRSMLMDHIQSHRCILVTRY